MKKLLLLVALGCAGALWLADGAEARHRNAGEHVGHRDKNWKAQRSVYNQPTSRGGPQGSGKQAGGQRPSSDNAQVSRNRPEDGNVQQGLDQSNVGEQGSARQGADYGAPTQGRRNLQETESSHRNAEDCRGARYHGPIIDTTQDVSLRAVLQVAKRAFFEASTRNDTISQSDLAPQSVWNYFYSVENYGKTLTRQEFLSMVQDMFDEVDRNHDGVLEPRELQSRRGVALLDIIEG